MIKIENADELLEEIKKDLEAMSAEEFFKELGVSLDELPSIDDDEERTMNKYDKFSDDELYILKRMTIESSYEFNRSGRYNKFECKVQAKLHNEIIDEIKRREGGKT